MNSLKWIAEDLSENQGILIHIWPMLERETMIQEVLQSINNLQFQERSSVKVVKSQVNCIKSAIAFYLGQPQLRRW